LALIFFAEHDVSAFYIYPIWILLFIGVSFVGGKMLENIDAFGISGLVMMLSGLVCTDTEIAKFSLSQGFILINHVAIDI
jgi:FHS family L-fucose permease-like MFS transporter